MNATTLRTLVASTAIATATGAVTSAAMADGYQYISFYGPVPARYLRLTIESGESAVSSLAELGVFVN